MERNSGGQCRLGLQQARGWNKWEMVVLNALEQMEKIQQQFKYHSEHLVLARLWARCCPWIKGLE